MSDTSDRQLTCSVCGGDASVHHWYPSDETGFRLCCECNPGDLRGRLAKVTEERDKLRTLLALAEDAIEAERTRRRREG